MKKLAIIVLCIAVLVLAGCKDQTADQVPSDRVGKTTTTTSTETTTTKTTPSKTTTTTTAPQEEEYESEPAKVPTKQIAALLQKHVGRVESLKYMYQDPTNKPEEWETWLKGDLMHVKLRELDNVEGDTYIDNVYLDISARKAVGYCEATLYRCKDPNAAVPVSFAKYYRKTPLEWIQDVTYAEKVSEEQMQMRTVVKMQYQEGEKTVTLWVDDYYGVPLKVRVAEGSTGTDYVFEDLAINDVEDRNLAHQVVTKSYN